jgi:alkyl sulfatase BDS1-like metallo-beta-lactamase superfamily hydrolase
MNIYNKVKSIFWGTPLAEVLHSGRLRITGQTEFLAELLNLFDVFTRDFNITLP